MVYVRPTSELMFIESYRYLNWSGRRYRVSQFGEVFDANGNKIATEVENDQVFIELEWVLGKRKYLAALIVLIAYDKLFLPDHLLDNVEPLYVDDSSRNLTPANLLYRFKNGPLEIEGCSGFYYVPMFAHYAINRDGVLINAETGYVKSWSLTREGGPKNQTGGYSYTRVIDGVGGSKVLFLHRALCLTFKPYDHQVLNLVVNHKDGNPKNNTLDNLEWATCRENILHARDNGLTRDFRIPVLMKDLKTGEVQRFDSVTACGRYLGLQRGEAKILNRIRSTTPKVFEDMLVFKFDDGQPWPDYDLEAKRCRLGRGSKIVARNVFTGELIVFQGSYEGERHTGVKAATILKHVRNSEDIPVGGYNFRYFDEVSNWPEHSEKHLLVYRDYPVYPPDGIIVKDLTSQEERFYTSSAKVLVDFPMSKSHFWHLVKTKKPHKEQYLFSAFKLRESLGLPQQ